MSECEKIILGAFASTVGKHGDQNKIAKNLEDDSMKNYTKVTAMIVLSLLAAGKFIVNQVNNTLIIRQLV